MLDILKVDHIGIRIRDKARSIAFYEGLGFKLLSDVGFDNGHPVIMEHPSGVNLNLLGPSTVTADENVLMDIDDKYAGYTHVALSVQSIEGAEALMDERGIAITGRAKFGNWTAIFVRDPDRNVIELNTYSGQTSGEGTGYQDHP